jgi:L-ascorbate metabolism protein UlaG (beta-lactamase superfamily)
MIEQIQWLGQWSFNIQGPPLISINPWRAPRGVFHADVILISHSHFERFSLAGINKLRGPNTQVIACEAAAREIEDCVVLRPWQSLTIDRACIKAVPAYSPANRNRTPEEAGLGFIISLNFFDIYYTGDTRLIPEMQNIRPDIAILPIGSDGAMTLNDAAEVVRALRPRWVIPGSWGKITETDTNAFRREIADFTEVISLPRQI